MPALHQMTLEQAADLIVSRLPRSVKYAEGEAPVAAPAASTAAPGMADKLRAMLSNIDFSGMASNGLEAAKGFSPLQNTGHAALLGGGLGLGAGALSALTSEDKEKRKRWLRHALFGGAMGGIGGLALGSINKAIPGLITKTQGQIDAGNKRVKPGMPAKIQYVLDSLADPGNHKKEDAVLGGESVTADTIAALSKNNPAALIGSGAVLGGGTHYLGSRLNHSAQQTHDIRNAINSAKNPSDVTERIDAANARLQRMGQAPITPEQVAATAVPQSHVAHYLHAMRHNAAAGAHNVNARARNLADEYFRPVQTPARKPIALREHVPWFKPKLDHVQRNTLHSGVVPHGTAPFKPRFGKGMGIGAAIGAGLGLMGAPDVPAQNDAAMPAGL